MLGWLEGELLEDEYGAFQAMRQVLLFDQLSAYPVEFGPVRGELVLQGSPI